VLVKILFDVHLKHSSFLPSADIKPISNDLVHAVPLAVHDCSLSLCVYYCLRAQVDLVLPMLCAVHLMLCAVVLSAVMLSVVLVILVILSAIMLSVVMLRGHADCCFAECHSAV
jgi:hypothetical protein